MPQKITTEIKRILNSRLLKRFYTSSLYSNAFFLMLDRVVTSALGFVFWLVVARYYNDADVGFSTAIVSVIGVIALLSMGGLDVTIVRYLARSKRPQWMINTGFTIVVLVCLVVSVVYLAGIKIWSPPLKFINSNPVFIAAFISFNLITVLFRVTRAVFIARRRAGYILIKDMIFALLKIPLPIFLASYFLSFGIVASWGIASAVSLLVVFVYLLPKVERSYRLLPALHMGVISRYWRYSISNYLANVVTELPFFLMPIIIVNVLGAQSNAYYYVAHMMAVIMNMVSSSIASSLLAEGSYSSENFRVNAIKAVKFSYALLIPLVIVFLLTGKWLLLIFGASYSENARQLLQLLALASFPSVVNNIYYTVLRFNGRIGELTSLRIFSSAGTVLISYLILQSYGITAVGYVTLGVQGIIAVYVLIRRIGIY